MGGANQIIRTLFPMLKTGTPFLESKENLLKDLKLEEK